MTEPTNHEAPEHIYYSKGTTFVSNKKIKFLGFKEESLTKEPHEIPVESLWLAYIEPPVAGLSGAVIISLLFYAVAFNLFLDAINNGTTIITPLTVLSVVLAANIYLFKINKNTFKKLKVPLKVQSNINNYITQYSIDVNNLKYDANEIGVVLIEINKARENYKKIQKEMTDTIKKEQDKTELETIKLSFKEFMSKNNIGEIDIPNTDAFSKHLESYQHEIAKFDQSWIHDLVKIKSYLQSANISIKSNFQQTIEEDNLEYFKQMQAEVINQVEAYDKVYGNALILIDSIIESNHVLSYEIYEIFDKLGFFESNWEQRLIQKFDDLSDSINETNANINSINEKFDLITNTSISKMVKEAGTPNLIKTGMPLLSMYGGYKLGYHMFGPSKNNSN